MLKNKIWIIQFLLRKKCSWYVGIILIMYLMQILYLIFDYPHKHYTFKYFAV